MRRILVLVVGLVLELAFAPASIAARPGYSGRVPAGINPSVLHRPIDGGMVASGHLKDRHGHSASGVVALVAWPNEAFRRTLKIGDSVETPTVGWGRTDAAGLFTLNVDPALVSDRYVNTDGQVNFQAVAWTADSQGTWSFSAKLDGLTPASLTIKASAPLATSNTNVTPDVIVPCYWNLKSTFDADVIIGYAFPYGQDKGWMKSSSGHSETVGIGASSSGAYGSWSANGTSSTSTNVTMTWAESIAYRDFRDNHRYGRYQYQCGVPQNSWMAMELYPTGGFPSSTSPLQNFAYSCPTVSAGLWERSQSNGRHFSSSVGVQAASWLGINLSIDTNWDTAHTLYYRLVANGKVCGNDNVPSLASRVRTTR